MPPNKLDTRPDSSDSTDTPPTPENKRRMRLSYVFFTLFALSIVFSLYPLPFRLAAGLFAVAGIVWGIRLLIVSLKTKAPALWTVAAVAGIFACAYGVLTTLGTAVMYPVQQTYEECMRTAITQEALISCQTEYQQGLDTMFKELTGNPLPRQHFFGQR